MSGQYIQYGCGFSAPNNWKNFDASLTLRFERFPIIGKFYTKNNRRFPKNVDYGDIVSGLPLSENSCQGVYCSHVLEHLSLEDFRQALKNTYKIMKNNAYFRLVLPDLEYLIKQYINNPHPDAALIFMEETSLGKEKRSKRLKGFVQEWLGNSQHLWMWDYKSLAHELENAGFSNIRRAVYGDAIDTMFNSVEEATRWENCLGVECVKI